MELHNTKLSFLSWLQLSLEQRNLVKQALVRLSAFNWTDQTVQDWYSARKIGFTDHLGIQLWGLVGENYRLLAKLELKRIVWYVGHAWKSQPELIIEISSST